MLQIHWPKLFTRQSIRSLSPSFTSALKVSQEIKGILTLSVHDTEIKTDLHNIEIKPDLFKMPLQHNADEIVPPEALVAFTIKNAGQASTNCPLLIAMAGDAHLLSCDLKQKTLLFF